MRLPLLGVLWERKYKLSRGNFASDPCTMSCDMASCPPNAVKKRKRRAHRE